MSSHDQRKDPSQYACPEYGQLSRRRFVSLSGLALAATAVPSWLPKVALAQDGAGSRDVLVSLFLRGGCDALTMVAPFGESAYYDLRPGLAIPRPDASGSDKGLDLDGFFAFAPAMAPLVETYNSGDLLIVHACGQHHPTRSHFDAMRHMEIGQGDPPASLGTGWLGRHLQMTAPTRSDAVLRAIGFSAGLQQTLAGAPQSLPIPEPESFGLAGREESESARRQALDEMYRIASEALSNAAENTLSTFDLLQSIDFAGYQPAGGATYADDELGQALRSTAALIRADVGVEAAAIDMGGWDTHENQEPLSGNMSRLMASFASGLAAFHQDLDGAGVGNVTVVVMSEFGRNTFENGSRGTDHGHGGMMMVMGSHVAGGRVLSEWPGLEREQLYEGQDLAVTIDYRDVLTEVLEKRLQNPDFGAIFPDPEYQPRELGVVG